MAVRGGTIDDVGRGEARSNDIQRQRCAPQRRVRLQHVVREQRRPLRDQTLLMTRKCVLADCV